jgi:hypothetical protein
MIKPIPGTDVVIQIHCIDCRKYFGEMFVHMPHEDDVMFHRFQCHECILKSDPRKRKQQKQ